MAAIMIIGSMASHGRGRALIQEVASVSVKLLYALTFQNTPDSKTLKNANFQYIY